MTKPQATFHPALRLVAAGCALLWLLATSYCSAEHLLGLDHHKGPDAPKGSQHYPVVAGSHESSDGHSPPLDDGAQHSSETERTNHGSPHHRHGGSCCSTLQATTSTAHPVVLAKPVPSPASFLCLLIQAPNVAPHEAGTSDRRAKSRGWALTPEVCTGSANRTHAPPASV